MSVISRATGWASLAATVAVGVAGLVVAGPAPAGGGPDGLVVAAATWGARVAAGYLLLCVAVVLAGRVGHRQRRLPGTPRWLVAAADLALGAVLVLPALPVVLADAPGGGRSAHPAAAGGTAMPALGWPSSATPSPAAVVVRPGDSLWSIAAAAAPPPATATAVALAWPRWWHRNRAVIGPDPNVIRPGQRLVAPRPDPRSAR